MNQSTAIHPHSQRGQTGGNGRAAQGNGNHRQGATTVTHRAVSCRPPATAHQTPAPLASRPAR